MDGDAHLRPASFRPAAEYIPEGMPARPAEPQGNRRHRRC